MRQFLAVVALGCAVTAVVPAAGLSAPRGSRTSLKIERPSVRPKRVHGNGADIFVSARIRKSGATVEDVQAKVVVRGLEGPLVDLENVTGDLWRGTLAVPVNTVRRNSTGTVTVVVTTSDGQTESRRLGTIVVGPRDDRFPPPPPPN
jgi:hypothetical protein